MILPVAVAKKLILLQDGNAIPFSKMPTAVIGEMLENGILKKRVHGRKKILVYLPEKQLLDAFLQNHYGISSLQDYVGEITKSDISRARAVLTSSDSKMKKIRTFKGFLVNCYDTIPATIHDRQITLSQGDGTFQFIHDYEHFRLPPETTVVGVENAENFWRIEQQRYLFDTVTPLFVCRYPQNKNKDLIKWLCSIPNPYLHFGDFDFAGIGIYLYEYKKYLANKATFFIPENLENMLANFGNYSRYNKQRIYFDLNLVDEKNLIWLVDMIHKYKKGLDQEAFIRI